jgi:ring-1,2-phenylacetyl-CoA epoxidase subunit PaaE
LKDRFVDRLSLYHVLSREEQDVPLLSGRLDSEKIAALFTHVLPAAHVDQVFLCGPGELIESARETLKGLGVSADKIHAELFTPADGSAPHAPKPPQDAKAVDHGAVASVILDGVRSSVPVAPGETIIEAAGRAGLEVPYSCKGGMCCTCRAKIVDGAVDMATNYSLEPWEIEAGFVLTCQSRPTSDALTVDFDQA